MSACICTCVYMELVCDDDIQLLASAPNQVCDIRESFSLLSASVPAGIKC